MLRMIMHIDMDAFYSSVEERENPTLKGRPVIVGADPKDGNGRGVVAGCSYEARTYGVRSAQPISQAFRLCPGAAYLRPNFKLYEDASSQVMGVLSEFTQKLEQVSIDEAFMDVTSSIINFGEAERLAVRIKDEVQQKFHLTCSVGVAATKAVAKIASDFKKPNGLTVVPPERTRDFLAPLPVTKISGVGKKSAEVLKRMGVNSIGDLAALHPSKMTEAFGRYGTRLWQIAHGIDDEEVITSYTVKSISSEATFEQDSADEAEIMNTFRALIEEVHSRTISQNMLFRTVGIKVRFEDFSTFTRARTHTRLTDEKPVIEEYVGKLFNEFKRSQKKIRLVGVRVTNLRKMDHKQESIMKWAKQPTSAY